MNDLKDFKIITSPDNQEIKEAKKLHDSKHRKKEKLFFFEGVHLLEEFLKNGKKPYRIFITETAFKTYEKLLGTLDSDSQKCIRIINDRIYDKITVENSPQGIFTIAEFSSVNLVVADSKDIATQIEKPAVVLESMRDPGNVGTVIRTAVSLGVNVIFTEDCADLFSSKVIRATMGALFAEKFFIIPNAHTLAKEATSLGFDVYGAILDPNAKKLGSFKFSDKSLFIIGNEGAGLKAETISLCNKYAFIPMTGKTESLNAAIAASLIMWEITKTMES